ncbi:hypothetical protein E4V01_01550 [Methylorubrum sp. Q1]|uniref:hypothetical protein n=1 Tax=Methylorubrum sp. Q1 TaxID=2562453 RepID=UPI0010763072|nr:hypothetical protein [Methylorubrum sp. Q1]TFZ61314.1 hypothetical protein E4V01_01550 [Methylorubrum sp. Q1]
MTAGRQRVLGALLALSGLHGSSVSAADLPMFEPGPPMASAAPRFFPRGDGDAEGDRPARPLPRRLVGCAPRIAPVPTNAPYDPSYVGSEYGLGKPSYYGFRPGPGYDDPFDRPLRYCP